MDLVSGSRGVHERSGDSGLRTLYLGKYTQHIFIFVLSFRPYPTSAVYVFRSFDVHLVYRTLPLVVILFDD